MHNNSSTLIQKNTNTVEDRCFEHRVLSEFSIPGTSNVSEVDALDNMGKGIWAQSLPNLEEKIIEDNSYLFGGDTMSKIMPSPVLWLVLYCLLIYFMSTQPVFLSRESSELKKC